MSVLESESWLSIALFIGLLFISAFFSGSETALFSLKASDRRKLREQMSSSYAARRILALLKKPRRLLVSILIGNTVVNVAAATIAALFTRDLLMGTDWSQWSFIINIVVVTGVILLFSEILPKIVAVKGPVVFASKVSPALSGCVNLFLPLSFLFEQLAHIAVKVLRVQKEVPFVNEEELKTLIEVGEDKGTLDQAEREMIHSIFEFHETMAKEVMVPRMDMVSVEKSTPLDEILNLVNTHGHSRIPVYQEKIDNIVGILYVKDLLSYTRTQKKEQNLSNLVRKPYFVPESKPIDELLREFQKERIHMAIVVDEYGGTAGLVTMEDVIEEIVGEIRDEYDQEKPLIKQMKSHEWLVDGKINIETLNEELDLALPPEEDFESLGGFIFSRLGSIPKEKEFVQFGSYQFVVEKVVGRRIKSVRILEVQESEKTETVSN